MIRRPLFVLLAAVPVLAACGGDDDAATTTPPTTAAPATTAPAPTTDPPESVGTTVPATTAAPTTVAPTTAAPTTAAPTTDVPGTTTPDPVDLLGSLLVTVDELNAISGDVEFVDHGWQNTSSDAPCGGPGVDAAFPPLAEVGTTLGTETVGVGLIEQILVYPSSADAGEALAHGLGMFACGTTPDGAYTFAEPVDVTVDLVTDPEVAPEADYSVSVIEFSGDDTVGAMWITRFNDSIIVFQFVRDVDFPIDTLPALPADIVSMGVSKVFQFLI